MPKHSSWLLLAAAVISQAAVINPGKIAQSPRSELTCACTHTVTHYTPSELKARQEPCPAAPAPVTITETQMVTSFVNQPVATVIQDDPASVSAYFSSVGAIDTAVIIHSSEDRPVNQPADTGPNYLTHTASGPAIVASDNPSDSTNLYRVIGTTNVPVSTITESFPAAGPVITAAPDVNVAPNNSSMADEDGDATVTTTIITYASTVTVAVAATITQASNVLAARKLQKRQTCSMIFAKINGEWASWCNNWAGTSTLPYTSWDATTLITYPVGLSSPIPESVWHHVPNPTASVATTISEPEPTSTSVPHTLPGPPVEPTSTSVPATLPGVHSSPVKPTSTSIPQSLPGAPYTNSTTTDSGKPSPHVTSHVFTSSVVLTIPLTTLTTVLPGVAPSASASPCGQIGQFSIGFDDLPRYSNTNPNDTASPPIFDPYDHMYWSSGFGYGPSPPTPYEPHDGDRLAIYNPLDSVEAPVEKTEGRFLPGSFGAGPRFSNKIFWFNAKSVYVGCNNTMSTDDCQLTATGYRWSANASANGTVTSEDDPGHEVFQYSQQYTIPAVCAEQPCPLTEIDFDASRFVNLSTMNLVMKLGNTEIGFYLDSFNASWSDNSCQAGLARAASRK